MPLTAVCVFGTRPDAIKMAPVVLELRQYPERWNVRTIVTGQHREQLDQVLEVFNIHPDVDLNIMQHGQTLAQITTRALKGLDQALAEIKGHVVLAQGDTTTTFVAALAAFYHKIPFAHVEAGLRTQNMYDPFPEEMNRRLTASLATFHFAPTAQARANLLAEGIPSERITVTGNTGIDALLQVAARDVPVDDPTLARVLNEPGPIVVITAHRRENWGEPMARICHAVGRLAEAFPSVRFVFAWHRNPIVRETVQKELPRLPNVHVVEPPAYGPFVRLLKASTLIVTDSGGLQEEAPSLGVPVLVLRKTTERPEGVEAGTARLVGTDPDLVYEHASLLLTNETERQKMRSRSNPYGDGQAARRIRTVLEEVLTD